MNPTLADISVIIPAYNRAGLIGETLRSLLSQTVPAKEIIVVDDGSQDGTSEAVLRYAADNGCLIAEDGGAAAAQPMAESEFRRTNSQNPNRHSLNDPLSAIRNPPSITVNPRIRVIKQANAGPGAARNRGLAEATGEFIHFFDSDDIAAPNKHEVQLRALLETGADIAYGPWVKGRFVENERPMTDSGELMAERRVAPKIDRTTNHTDTHERGEEVLTTIERQGGREKEQPKVGPKGEGVGTTESNGPDKHGFGNHQRHELTRKEEAGQRLARQAGAAFSNPSTSELARDSENPSLIRSADGPAEALDARRWTLDAGPLNFVPEGPVLQARGLPEGDLVRALLMNWSIVPHACLFRRAILEKAGGFPEDIWVGEDQFLFLRCLLAGAKVVHTPETMVFYRVGDDPGKLTATGVAQKRHARDWARFLLKANQEVEEKAERLKSEVVKAPATSYSPPATAPEALTTPSAWFGFRLRAYEAWWDLEKFFPVEENELKNELQGIWKRNWFSGSRFQASGFVLRKLGGLKLRVLGYREHDSFRCGKFSSFIDFGG